MSRRVRRFLLGILAGLALVSSLSIGSLASAHAASRTALLNPMAPGHNLPRITALWQWCRPW